MRREMAPWLIVPLAVLVGWWWWGAIGPNALEEEGADLTNVQPTVPKELQSDQKVVMLAELPPEAAQTIALIKADGPYPFPEDDAAFGNIEGLLPEQESGYYREYTVVTPGSKDRGARRIVVGAGGEYYWTMDHYRSFERIANP